MIGYEVGFEVIRSRGLSSHNWDQSLIKEIQRAPSHQPQDSYVGNWSTKYTSILILDFQLQNCEK